MLWRILALLSSGGGKTLESMALDLDVGRAEVEDMLARLCALGYVEELGAALSASCADGGPSACAGCSGCSRGQGPSLKCRVWSLTDKGKGALAERGRVKAD